MLALDERGGDQDLRRSERQSVIPYVHSRNVILSKRWLFLLVALSGLPELGLREPV
jgi:hypothetical protein